MSGFDSVIIPSQQVGILSLEDTRVTMQIGLVGSNGIVLASDRKWSIVPPSGGVLSADGWISTKFVIGASRKVAVMAAGDMSRSIRIAARIAEEMDDSNEYTRDRRIYDIGSQIAQDKSVECVIAFLEPHPRLHFFQYLNSGADIVNTPIDESIHAGDRHNPAIFWTAAHYRRGSTQSLKRLAAQVITTAGMLNPAGIAGLEIVWSGKAGFNVCTEQENQRYLKQAKNLHKQAGQLIYGGAR